MSARRALLLYGIVLAVLALVAAWHVWNTSRVTIMGSRIAALTSAIDVVDHGGPPLLASTLPYSQSWRTTPAQSYYSAAHTDDPGVFLYLPEAGRALGIHDPRILLKLLALGSFALLALVYPLVFYELFGSVAAGVVAPLFLGAFTFLANSDIYWISGWCALLCLPLLFLAATRPWTRLSTAVCVGTAFVGSYASSIRSQAGLGVAIAALAVAVARAPAWRRRVAVAALVVAAYLSIRPALIRGVEAYRDHEIAAYIDAHPTWRNVSSSGHPLWHSAYIGLGYLPNKYGIRWSDSVAAAAVRRVDPSAPFLSPRYSAILRRLYFHIVRTDPGFVAHTYADKAAVEANDALKRFLPGLVLLPAFLLYGRRRRLFRIATLLTLPTILIQFTAPVLTIPGVYGVGFLSAVGLLALLAGCEVAARAADLVAARGDSSHIAAPLRDAFRERRAWVAALSALALVVATVALHSQHAVVRL
ncbi:MAG TPA: hypothetical protein VGK79_01600 [Gaiellaceae bacterium]